MGIENTGRQELLTFADRCGFFVLDYFSLYIFQYGFSSGLRNGMIFCVGLFQAVYICIVLLEGRTRPITQM